MSIQFKTYSIPDAQTENITVSEEDTAKISRRLRKISHKLSKKMKAINQKEKRSWQISRPRN